MEHQIMDRSRLDLIKPGQMTLYVGGCSGSVPALSNREFERREYGTATTSYLLEHHFEYDGEQTTALVIVDSGTGIMNVCKRLFQYYSEFTRGQGIATAVQTHVHWDHIQGFPFFKAAWIHGNKFHIYGNPKATIETQIGSAIGQSNPHLITYIEGAFKKQQDPNSGVFPVGLERMSKKITFDGLGIDLRTSVLGLEIDYREVKHPQECYSFKFINGNSRTVVITTDYEHNENLDGLAPEDISIARWWADAHVILADGQYTPNEFLGIDGHIKVGWGHSVGEKILRIAHKSLYFEPHDRKDGKRLYIIHHDPDHSDEQLRSYERHLQQLAEMNYKGLHVKLARECDLIEI